MAQDRFGRRIHYLRISLTDHCNLRCIYCMPEDSTFRPNAELIQDDEIVRLTRLFVELGFDKFRLTGGEPTVRAGVVDLVRRISNTPGVSSLSMTTNGLLMSKLAGQLKEAGLRRVNFSLDTLNAEKYKLLTRRGSLDDVWNGIQAAEEAGLLPIKINCVVVRGFSENEVVEVARLTLHHPWHVRFIELMPFAGATEFQRANVVSSDEIRSRLESQLGVMDELNGGLLDGEARTFRLEDGKGSIGFISTITQPFCESCTRARLTADGRLRLCLLDEYEVDLLTSLRCGASDADLLETIRDAIWNKPWGNKLSEGFIPLNRSMSEIGG